MRVLQVTNIISHHQLPLAHCLAQKLGGENFRFATTDPPDPERQKLGWSNETREPWILRVGENSADRLEFERWWHEADMVFCGERLFDLMRQRLDRGKLTFYMSERWFKPPIGAWRLLFPHYARMVQRFRRLATSAHLHYLPMGEYAAVDMQQIAPFSGRIWRWGYFTAMPEPLPDCTRTGNEFRVLWAGRMLGWKRVDTLIRAFSAMLLERPDAILTLVGDGPERNKLVGLAGSLVPAGSVRFMPPCPVGDIAKLMRQQHVFVLSSNAYEGWGAVVNEAMSEGCAVIASNASGSARSIIRHEENGLLFSPGDWRGLSSLLGMLSTNRPMREKLARVGQREINSIWSPLVAAERLLDVTNAMLSESVVPSFKEGPMVML